MFETFPESELREFARRVRLSASRFLEGHHQSHRAGSGQEYHEHLAYSEGEDARQIDWKRWAASDKLLVRRFQEQKKTSWKIVLDQSSSMAFGDKEKFAKFLATSIVCVSHTLGDQWEIVGFDSSKPLAESFRDIFDLKFGGNNLLGQNLVGSRDQRLVVISDFFEELDSLHSQIKVWVGEFRSVLLIQILDPEEVSFPFVGATEFQDMESSSKIVLNPSRVKDAYEKYLRSHQESLRQLVTSNQSFISVEAREDNILKCLEKVFEEL